MKATAVLPCDDNQCVEDFATIPLPQALAQRNGQSHRLENGDSLTAAQFLRRARTLPEDKTAELIEGVVFMAPPIRTDVHAEPDNLIQTWMGLYAIETPGVKASGDGTVRLDLENVPQPDGALRILPVCGGSSRLDRDGYLVGPPELVVEIAASSSSIDLHGKLRAYQRNGIQEYLVWRTTDAEFDWFVLKAGAYRPQRPDARGLCRSASFPGLTLNVPALLAQNGAAVLATLRAGLKSRAHKTFVATLAKSLKK